MEMKYSGPRGAHFVATRALCAGEEVINCAALASVVSPPLLAVEMARQKGRASDEMHAYPFRCDRCKRPAPRESSQDAHRVRECPHCGFFALCTSCEALHKGWERHRLECRAFNKLAMLVEPHVLDSGSPSSIQATGTPLISDVLEHTSPQLLLFLLRIAVHGVSSMQFETEDPWAKRIVDGGNILTHQSLRSAREMGEISAAATFARKIATSCGQALASQHELEQVLMRIHVNGHELLDPCTQNSIGVGLYPSGTIFNHDCWPNADFLGSAQGGLRVVTTRPVGAGEELTIQYTDTLTSPTKSRRDYLESVYHFRCSCTRCERDSGFDQALIGPQDATSLAAEDHIRALHRKAGDAPSIKKGLALFRQALAYQGLPELHVLNYTSADGVLIHAKALGRPVQEVCAIRRLLDFYEARDTYCAGGDASATNDLLPVAQVGLLLELAHALARAAALGKAGEADFTIEGRAAIEQAMRCLEPFGVDTIGLKCWLSSTDPCALALDHAVLDIFWGNFVDF